MTEAKLDTSNRLHLIPSKSQIITLVTSIREPQSVGAMFASVHKNLRMQFWRPWCKNKHPVISEGAPSDALGPRGVAIDYANTSKSRETSSVEKEVCWFQQFAVATFIARCAEAYAKRTLFLRTWLAFSSAQKHHVWYVSWCLPTATRVFGKVRWKSVWAHLTAHDDDADEVDDDAKWGFSNFQGRLSAMALCVLTWQE